MAGEVQARSGPSSDIHVVSSRTFYSIGTGLRSKAGDNLQLPSPPWRKPWLRR